MNVVHTGSVPTRSTSPCGILAIYNDRAVLSERIVALLRDCPPDAGLVVVDDGSTDGTSPPLPQDARVLFHRLPANGGRVQALRAGIRLAGRRPVVLHDPRTSGKGWELEQRRRTSGHDVAIAAATKDSSWHGGSIPVIAGNPELVDRLLSLGHEFRFEDELALLGASVLWVE